MRRHQRTSKELLGVRTAPARGRPRSHSHQPQPQPRITADSRSSWLGVRTWYFEVVRVTHRAGGGGLFLSYMIGEEGGDLSRPRNWWCGGGLCLARYNVVCRGSAGRGARAARAAWLRTKGTNADRPPPSCGWLYRNSTCLATYRRSSSTPRLIGALAGGEQGGRRMIGS